MMNPIWLRLARKVKQLAIKNDSLEVFVQPVFEGKSISLEYKNLELVTDKFSQIQLHILKRSHVPLLLNEEYPNWGGISPSVLFVNGTLVKSRVRGANSRFVATGVTGPGGKEYHPQITTLNLLHARGFITPLGICCWAKTFNLSVSSLKETLSYVGLKTQLLNTNFKPVAPVALQLYDCLAFRKISKQDE